MCGIAGFIALRRDQSSETLTGRVTAMADAIRHRGPDSSGIWADPESGMALGHRRLAIVDLSPAGHQPMISESGRYVTVFNGEIYNFPSLKERLGGRAWRGGSDTEVMLAAIETWGIERALAEMNGMFAIALWDRQERILHLARDRIGKKPLYYGQVGDTFLFGSELKALRAHPSFRADIDRKALAAYTRHNYVPAPWSIYKGIFKLPAATLLSVPAGAPGSAKLAGYWDIKTFAETAQASPAALSLAEAADRLDGLLGTAVRERMIADVPLGAFLSGGIDSSLVTALMQKHSAHPVRTFSIGFGEKAYNEAESARLVAGHLGTNHTEFTVTAGEAQETIPLLPEMFDEPFADSSQIPTWHVARLARRHVTVALSGDGGDESFAGYPRYRLTQDAGNALFMLPVPLRAILFRALRPLPLRGKMRKLASIMDAADRDEFYRLVMTYWRSRDAVLIDETEALHSMNDPASLPRLKDGIHRMMLRDTLAYLPDDILVKVDRTSMNVALEARAPLLDKNVIEFAWTLPLAMKTGGGRDKIILREVLKRYVPEALFDRPKQGFSVPIAEWLRGPLRDWAETLLAEDRLRAEDFFNPAPVRARWEAHLRNRDDWSQSLWGVLMFQAWLERNAAS